MSNNSSNDSNLQCPSSDKDARWHPWHCSKTRTRNAASETPGRHDPPLGARLHRPRPGRAGLDRETG